jgi:hypothetical protein
MMLVQAANTAVWIRWVIVIAVAAIPFNASITFLVTRYAWPADGPLPARRPADWCWGPVRSDSRRPALGAGVVHISSRRESSRTG